MFERYLVAVLVGCTATSGCATAVQTLAALPIIPKKTTSRYSPEFDIKLLQEEQAEKRAQYYQDGNGLRPGLTNSIGAADETLAGIFEIKETPVGIAPARVTPMCNDDEDNTREWQADASGVKDYFAKYPQLAKNGIALKMRDQAFWVALNFQTSGGFQRTRLLEGSDKDRAEEYKLAPKLAELKEKLAAVDKCPHAPSGLGAELAAYADQEYEKNIKRLNAFFDAMLVKELDGKKMIADAKHIKGRDRKSLDKLAHQFLSDYKIVTLRFVDNWHNVNEKRFENNVWTHIHEDYTRINAYVDLGPEKPFIKCFALDGIRDYNAGKRLSVNFARRYGYCDSVRR